uniref:HTH OST-type domain-containing protein n=1 Tax=Octopus bimaculoides TaxID=37653 RepID=A0A0L8GJ76_OCTBM
MENIDLKKKIRSVLLSSKHGVRKTNFLKEYKQLTGEDMDVRRTGFTTVDDFLGSIPDTVVREGNYYFAVSCDATHHIEKLIQQQKSDRKLKTKEISSRHQKPSRHYVKNEKRRLYETKPDRFSRYSNDNRMTRSVSMNQLTALPPRTYQKQASVPVTVDSSDVDELRTKLLSILYEASLGLNAKDLQKEYKSETGRYIPLKEYGYKSVDELMLNFSVDNTMCIKKGPFFVAVAHDTTINKSLQNRRYVSTPNLHNRFFISGNGRKITIHRRFNEFNDNSYQFQMSEQGLSDSRHCVYTTDSQSKFPCANCDCQCHIKKYFNMRQVDKCNKCRCQYPNDIKVEDSPGKRNREMKPPRTVTLVDKQEPNSTLKIQHGDLALQELRISVINTHLDDNNNGNCDRQINIKEGQKITTNYKNSSLNSKLKIKSENH